ncbi:hypothetical protein EV359DRAFT_81504 [Lentinula novae-zelandiae]|nr:hypothetical protein EV359DRAFT_81504 [Lentinula novae-zelandiae]
MLNLPEELLHIVAGYIAYSLTFIERELPEFHYKYATEEIRSLSLVCRRMRRICLPFLLAFVRIEFDSGITCFRDQCLANPRFAESIKALHISSIHLKGSDILRQLLPRLPRLSWIHFESFQSDVSLFIALHCQVNVKTVVIESVHHLTSSDASKVLLHRGEIYHPHKKLLWESHLSRGMQVAQLTIHQPHFLHEGFRRFSGLRELDLIMGRRPVTLSWLPEITSAHPQLQKITFQDRFKHYFSRKLTLPFISDFVDRVCREDGLSDVFDLTRLVVSRNTLPKQSSEQWHVSGLKIVVRSALDRILPIINSSFPNVSVLSLEFQAQATYHIDNFINMLLRFPSLKIVGLRHAFNHLHYGCRKPWTHQRVMVINQSKKTPAAIMVEAGMFWYMTCIAQAISSVEAFFVHEEGMIGCDDWTAVGWYTVQNVPESRARCVIGELDSRKGFYKRCEI